MIKYWGFTQFRELQEEIIRSVDEEGKDTLGLLPTGGGKSIIFQVPALLNKGLCLVVTPLIALMKDQVENLKAKRIKAAAIYSGLSRHEIDIILNNCVYRAYKFLYVSPERLQSDLFLARLPDMDINLLAIDEAHCISQWGYDFRPAYLKITEIRKYLPDVPVLALTATATKEVAADIQEKLNFKEKNLFRKSFERKNLVYIVRETEDKMRQLLKIANGVAGSGLVYVRNRKKTKEIAAFLQKNRVSADYYHAGIDNKLKDYKQKQWKTGRTRVIVATNAFGMGIDKADVRFVIHMDLPDSLEAYYQEAGRAGRDGKKSYAVLLFHKSDEGKLKKRISSNFPDKEFIVRAYQALGNYYQLPIGAGKGRMFDFKIGDFAMKFKLPILQTYSAFKILQNESYIELSEEFQSSSKVLFIIEQQELYKLQVAHKSLDVFIKLLLRTYAGIFSNYTNIDEEYIARQLKAKVDVVYDYLLKLSKLNVVKYIPQRKLPFIVYTEERLEEKNLRISKENYEVRRENFEKKINAVLNYASSGNKCRSQMLLEYFDEADSNRCGQCDVCRKRNKLELSKYEFDLILENIKPKLSENELSLEELVSSCKFMEQKLLKVISYLTENDKIILTDRNKYKWNQKN